MLIIAALVGGYFYHVHLTNKIEDLTVQLQTSEENLELCNNNQAALQLSLNGQNQEIERWTEVGREQDKKLAQLAGELSERQKVIDTRVRKVLSGKKPKNCDGAIKYLIDSAPELTWPSRPKR
jgi:chromosome segregation ATPase